jgi:Tfp pilus assembly PilM family ATPase
MATKNAVVGLDIGRHSVKAVWAVKQGKSAGIVRCETMRLALGGEDRHAVIRSWVEKTGIGRHRCAIGLASDQAMFQPFLLAEKDPRTPEQVAAMEVIRFNEMSSETMIYDFAPLSLAEGDRRLLLCMARPSVLGMSQELAKAVGMQIADMVPTPVALFNALESRSGAGGAPVAYVNIGHSLTEVAVGVPAGLMFARSFMFAGRHFTEALARARNVPEGQAETLKVTKGSLAADNPLAAALTAAADAWLSEFQSCMAVYQNHYGDKSHDPARIVLAGGGALLEGLPEYVASRLKVETVRAAATADGALPQGAEIATYAVAAGLAAAAVRKPACSLSLLPSDLRDELAFRRQKPYWIAAAVAAALILGVSLYGGYQDYRRMARHLKEQKDSLTRREDIARDIDRLKQADARLSSVGQSLENLLRRAARMRDVMGLVAGSKADEDRIAMICDGESYFGDVLKQREPPDRRRPPNAPPPPDAKALEEIAVSLDRVIVEGYTRRGDFSTVKALILNLSAGEFVESADLLADDKIQPPPPDRVADTNVEHRFVIDLRIRQK